MFDIWIKPYGYVYCELMGDEDDVKTRMKP